MPIFLSVLVALGAPVVLFRFRRRAATRWNTFDGAVENSDRPVTFRKVWWQFTPPRPSWSGRRDRSSGSLSIDPLERRIVLRSKNDGEVILDSPTAVSMDVRRELVIPWIEVQFESTSEHGRLFLNDCGWLGLHEALTGGNVRIARSIAVLLQ